MARATSKGGVKHEATVLRTPGLLRKSSPIYGQYRIVLPVANKCLAAVRELLEAQIDFLDTTAMVHTRHEYFVILVQ